MRFLQSVIVQDQLIAADGIYTYDLAVNPLSFITIGLRPLNDTGTLSNFDSYLNICQAINRLNVNYLGQSIVSMKGEDIAALNYFRHGLMPFQATHLDTDNFRRCVPLPVLFGRMPYDPKSCFPQSRRGELILELDLDIADTGYDGLRISIEATELLGAKPTEFERKVTVNQTLAATGDNDIDMPPGNVNRGVLLFGTTGFTGATPAPTLGRLKVLLDNQEANFAATDFEMSQMLSGMFGRSLPGYDGHKHRTTVDGNAQTLVTTVGDPYSVGAGWQNWTLLDFDPTRDDTFSLDTKGSSRFAVRCNAETADALRAIPIEVVKV